MTETDAKILEFIEEIQSVSLNDFVNSRIDAEALQHINEMVDRFQTDYEVLTSYLNTNNNKENNNG